MTPAAREQVRAELTALGFDEVRFAAVAQSASPAESLRAWLDAGNHADMDWLPRSLPKRLDPEQVLPGARSWIVLGVNYRPASAGANAQQRWAKYALWSDYHDTIGRGLRAAEQVLERELGLRRDDYRAYTDTGPVQERGWAAASGLGWRGKNGMLISRTQGNWLFLALILVRAEIPPDEPLHAPRERDLRSADETAPDDPSLGLFCGTCTRCLAACPTQAFPRPGWVDARRCIAYHTIENRGMIPRELRPGFGGRVFGCDVCLDVCPWNRFAQAARGALLSAREELVGITLLDLLNMDEVRFRELFRRSPVKRVKLPGLLRNACIAAGNWHDSAEWHFGGGEDVAAVASAVERLCAHASPVVRAHAVWALARLLGPDVARSRLEPWRRHEQDVLVLTEYAWLEPAAADARSGPTPRTSARPSP